MPTLLQTVSATDRAAAWARPAWQWLGQLAVIVLGTHLACDRLDDHVLDLLYALPIPWSDPAMPVSAAAYTSVVVEVAVTLWATWILWRSFGAPPLTRQQWWARKSVSAFLRPVFWAPTALAGAWVVGMAVQDLVAPYWETGGVVLGVVLGGLTAWRLAWTGAVRIVYGTRKPRRWWDEVWWAPVLVGVAALAVGSLPVWGWWA